MSRHNPKTPYGSGYLAGYAGKVKAAPAEYNEAQKRAWLIGYDDAHKASIESKRFPGRRPSMTR